MVQAKESEAYRIVIQCRPKEWLVTVQIGKQLGFHSSPIKQRVEECILLSFFLVGFFYSGQPSAKGVFFSFLFLILSFLLVRPKGLTECSLILYSFTHSTFRSRSFIHNQFGFIHYSFLHYRSVSHNKTKERSLTIRSFTIIAYSLRS